MRPPMKIEQVTIVGPGLLGAPWPWPCAIEMPVNESSFGPETGEACGLFRFGLV